MGNANTLPADARSAIDTIKAEHRSLGGVMTLLQRLLRNIAAGHTEADYELLASALYYIDDFAVRCHHPKEDRYLFVSMRRYVPGCAGSVEALQAEHQRDRDYVRDLHRRLVLQQAGAPDALKHMIAAFDIYASMLFDHMRKEEALLEQHAGGVPAGEWREIAHAFSLESDPLAGTAHEFAKLRARITNLLPHKMRFGPKES